MYILLQAELRRVTVPHADLKPTRDSLPERRAQRAHGVPRRSGEKVDTAARHQSRLPDTHYESAEKQRAESRREPADR
jgi:hypothetical protein